MSEWSAIILTNLFRSESDTIQQISQFWKQARKCASTLCWFFSFLEIVSHITNLGWQRSITLRPCQITINKDDLKATQKEDLYI